MLKSNHNKRWIVAKAATFGLTCETDSGHKFGLRYRFEDNRGGYVYCHGAAEAANWIDGYSAGLRFAQPAIRGLQHALSELVFAVKHGNGAAAWVKIEEKAKFAIEQVASFVPEFKCQLCGQGITDGKPCGCGAR